MDLPGPCGRNSQKAPVVGAGNAVVADQFAIPIIHAVAVVVVPVAHFQIDIVRMNALGHQIPVSLCVSMGIDYIIIHPAFPPDIVADSQATGTVNPGELQLILVREATNFPSKYTFMVLSS